MIRIRCAGSATPAGTSNRIKVARLPPTGVSRGSDTDRHRHDEVADRRAVLLVVSTQSPGDRGDERVVQRTAGDVAGPAQRLRGHLMYRQSRICLRSLMIGDPGRRSGEPSAISTPRSSTCGAHGSHRVGECHRRLTPAPPSANPRAPFPQARPRRKPRPGIRPGALPPLDVGAFGIGRCSYRAVGSYSVIAISTAPTPSVSA